MLDVDQDEQDEQEEEGQVDPPSQSSATQHDPRRPRQARKDKDLNTFLNSMDRYAPIVDNLQKARSN
jgi:hypothetical protein